MPALPSPIRPLGTKRDAPDPRDYKFADTLSLPSRLLMEARGLLPKAIAYPAHVDIVTALPKWFPPIFDQGDLGSCVENALSALLAYLEAKEGNGLEVFSRLFLYYNVRGGIPEDTGSSIRDGFYAVQKYGAPDESIWPYDLNIWTTKPPADAYLKARPRTNFVYSRIADGDLNGLMFSIARAYPVEIGMTVYPSMANVTFENPVLPMPKSTENWLGGHAVLLVGYDQRRRLFKVRNSWGPAWGEAGYFYMPFDYVLNSEYCWDFWTARYIAK
jgi:C1A family cysteine protease